jgi:hypothetical protein
MDPRHLPVDRRLVGGCVFCGGEPGTSDHVPSKVLLDDPLLAWSYGEWVEPRSLFIINVILEVPPPPYITAPVALPRVPQRSLNAIQHPADEYQRVRVTLQQRP